MRDDLACSALLKRESSGISLQFLLYWIQLAFAKMPRAEAPGALIGAPGSAHVTMGNVPRVKRL
jgi:hypothetical protein